MTEQAETKKINPFIQKKEEIRANYNKGAKKTYLFFFFRITQQNKTCDGSLITNQHGKDSCFDNYNWRPSPI